MKIEDKFIKNNIELWREYRKDIYKANELLSNLMHEDSKKRVADYERRVELKRKQEKDFNEANKKHYEARLYYYKSLPWILRIFAEKPTEPFECFPESVHFDFGYRLPNFQSPSFEGFMDFISNKNLNKNK